MKLTAVLVLLAFGIGSCFGGQLSEDSAPEIIKVERTKILRESAPEPEKVPYVPDSCSEALALADEIVRNAEALFHSGEEQINILQDTRLVLAAGSNTTAVEDRQRRLHGRTVEYLLNLEEKFALYEQYVAECKKE